MASISTASPEISNRPKLWLIEDDDAIRRGLQLLLHGHGYAVQSFASAQLAMADAGLLDAQYLVADYVLTELDGIAILRAMRARGWPGLAVLITAFPSRDVRAAAERAGFAAVLEKPFRDDDLLRLLHG